MEWIIWWTGSKNMTSICCRECKEQRLVYCTVCKAQSAQYARCKVYQCVENRLFCKEECLYRGATCFACDQLEIFHYCRIFLQNIDISDRLRFKSAQYCWFVWKVWTGMSVDGDAEQEVVSHPFPCLVSAAASVLPFNPCQLRPTNCTVGLRA